MIFVKKKSKENKQNLYLKEKIHKYDENNFLD